MGDSGLNVDVDSISTQETGIEKNDCKNNNDGKHDNTNENKHNTCIWIFWDCIDNIESIVFIFVL